MDGCIGADCRVGVAAGERNGGEGLLDDYLPRLTDPGGAVTFPLRALRP